MIPLEPYDERVGMGRVGKLARPVSVATLLRRIKAGLGIKSMQLIGPDKRKVSIAAVGAGSISDLMGDVLKSGAEFLLTGELRHNGALLAGQNNLTVAVAGHWTTERPGIAKLAGELDACLTGVTVLLSSTDNEPITIR